MLAVPHSPNSTRTSKPAKPPEYNSRLGVGLAIVRGILSEIGGTLRLEPHREKGLSRILCYFPTITEVANVPAGKLVSTATAVEQ